MLHGILSAKQRTKEKSIADKINRRQTINLGSSLKATDWNQLALSANHGISPGSQKGMNICLLNLECTELKMHKFKVCQKTA